MSEDTGRLAGIDDDWLSLSRSGFGWTNLAFKPMERI